MPIEEIILKLRRFRYWLLVFFLVSFGLTYYYMVEYRTLYEAEAVIMLNDIDLTDVGMSEKDISSMIRYNSFNAEKFYRFLYSDQLLMQVDAQLKLGEHYKLSRDDANYFYRLTNKFTGNLSVHKDGLDMINLLVTDKTESYAPVLMEAILSELKAIHRENSEDLIHERLQVVSAVQAELRHNYASFVDSINRALTLLGTSSSRRLSPSDYLELKYGILRTVDRLDVLAESFNSYTQMSTLSNQAFKSKGLDKLKVLNKKYYLPQSRKIIRNTAVSLFVSVIVLLVVIIAGYFYYTHEKLITLFLRGKSTEKL